ncbi:hypothetical protein HPP92_013167 [Vanilla planifolia]|uniref:EDR1/CTR1/ARMC3-like peptidase-like domain-containing protein n=1 Tax=Vanilla planifolia TaxID=51239 RepID=A0A835QSH9_VANPL|nr:hypothetical protein HPP92_013167 [Vanilla planifolia]
MHYLKAVRMFSGDRGIFICLHPLMNLAIRKLVFFPFSSHVQVNGCLFYSDKITDGFYNIMGLDPFLWVLCNDLDEGKGCPA